MQKEKILEAIRTLRSGKKREFSQSFELIINLKGIDIKKESIDFFVTLPHKSKDKRICAFFEKPIPEAEKFFSEIIFKDKLTGFDKKEAKKIAQRYDFFVSQAPLMASVASSFGRILGPRGKMPSPQLGSIITKIDEKALRELVEKLQRTVKLKAKGELALKAAIGDESMPDEQIADNTLAVYDAAVAHLPKGQENIKSFLIKTTMRKPIKLI